VSEGLEFVLRAALIGIGATAVMDLWAAFQKLVFGVPSLDYGMVGRWIGHVARGCFVHENIGKSSAVRGERVIGWGARHRLRGPACRAMGSRLGAPSNAAPRPDDRSPYYSRTVFHTAAGHGRRDRGIANAEPERQPSAQLYRPHGLRCWPIWLRLALGVADPGIESGFWRAAGGRARCYINCPWHRTACEHIADRFNGHIDEFRISHIQRSDGWIATTWNNLSDPGAFAAAGAEEQQGGEPPPLAGAGVVVCLMA
jgi:Protein of unknown function (DUF2938)